MRLVFAVCFFALLILQMSTVRAIEGYTTFTHIAHREEWEAQKDSKFYAPSAYNPKDPDSFVHCTQADKKQLSGVLERFFPNKTAELVLLFIDHDSVQAKVVEEKTPDGWFPHVYGAINKDAIYGVAPLDRSLMG